MDVVTRTDAIVVADGGEPGAAHSAATGSGRGSSTATGAEAHVAGSAATGSALRWSPAWVLEPPAEPGTLVLSAGADRRVAIDGVGAGDRAVVESWQAAARVADGPRTDTQARLLDRLVELGVVVSVPGPLPPLAVSDDPGVAAELGALLAAAAAALEPEPRPLGNALLPAAAVTVAEPEPTPPASVARRRADGMEVARSGDRVEAVPASGSLADRLVLAVRTGASWPALPPGRLHLGVDLALHHTVVLGPLVAPGVSACLACLDARMSHRWPRAPVPPAPAVQRHLPVVAALVAVQARLAAAGTSPLVNATIAWNLETGTTDRQALYKLPGCPACASAVLPPPALGAGRVALPWDAAT